MELKRKPSFQNHSLKGIIFFWIAKWFLLLQYPESWIHSSTTGGGWGCGWGVDGKGGSWRVTHSWNLENHSCISSPSDSLSSKQIPLWSYAPVSCLSDVLMRSENLPFSWSLLWFLPANLLCHEHDDFTSSNSFFVTYRKMTICF